MVEKITAIIPTFNNEAIIQRALDSVTWADELLVVDSYSTDRTLELVRQAGARVIQHKYINSALQKNWAIPQAKHEWIFLLDSDETLEPGFAEEVRDKLSQPLEPIDGFMMARKNLVFGKWVRTNGYYPDSLVRLFRRSCRYHEREVHAHIDIHPERMGQLEHHIIHHDFTDFDKYLVKFPRYMRYELDQLIKEGRPFRLRDITLRPIYFFFWSYIYKQGFRSGIRGFMIAVLQAFYNFVMYMKLWEHNQTNR